MCALLTGVQTCALPILLGLTRQGFEVSTNTTKAKALVRPDGSACVGFSDGTVVMRLNTEIFVASELATDSCLYGQVFNHEERHDNVGRSSAKRPAGKECDRKSRSWWSIYN